MALIKDTRRSRRGRLFVDVDDKRLTTGEQRVGEQPAELRVLELITLTIVRRVKVDQRIEHVHLPQAERLSKVAFHPRDGLPDVGHCHGAGAQLVVVVDEMEELAVEGVHLRLRRRMRVRDALARLVNRVPLLDLRVARQQVASSRRLRCTPKENPTCGL